MKAIRIHSYGTEEVLTYEDAPTGEISKSQVLVKIMATSVNHLEVMMASGQNKEQMPLKFPWIPGFEGAGIVEKADPCQTGFEKGEEVFFHCSGGSYAGYIVLHHNELVRKPENISFAKAACIPHCALTAWQGLFCHGDLEAGQRVLIHGGAGAVGSFAVQLAKHKGATVYTTANARDKEYLEELHADHIIDYKTTDFTSVAKDMDLVLVLTGGDTQDKSYSVIKPGGRLVTTTGAVNEELADRHHVTATGMVVYSNKQELTWIKDFVEAGVLTCDIGIIYSLSEAATAWKTYAGKNRDAMTFTHGKIVLETENNKRG